MEPSAASTTSRPSECPQSSEIERCERGIAAVENALRRGHRDIAGLCLALSDWCVELRILQNERRQGDPAACKEGELYEGR